MLIPVNYKRCTKCGEVKPIAQYNWKKTNVLRRSECKACWSIYLKGHYRRNRQYYLDKATKRINTIRARTRAYKLGYLMEHPCTDCGEARIPCLDFHHINDDKIETVSVMLRQGRKLELIAAEIDKCIVLCANCHRILHARERGMEIPDPELLDKQL